MTSILARATLRRLFLTLMMVLLAPVRQSAPSATGPEDVNRSSPSSTEIAGPQRAERLFEIEFLDPGVEAFAFTFG